jgi:hypothetical protein
VETEGGNCVEMEVPVHDLEVARQQSAVVCIDKDSAAESKVAKETTDLVLERLQDSNKCAAHPQLLLLPRREAAALHAAAPLRAPSG